MKNSTIRKQMTFPKKLVDLVEKKSKRLGFGFNEYVRFVLAQEVDTKTNYLDDETEKIVSESRRDFEKGKFVDANNPSDIDALLDV